MTSSTLAFLRAVNLPGRSFPSADIRRVAAEVGFSDPRTHAASGNLLVTGAGDRRAQLTLAQPRSTSRLTIGTGMGRVVAGCGQQDGQVGFQQVRVGHRGDR